MRQPWKILNHDSAMHREKSGTCGIMRLCYVLTPKLYSVAVRFSVRMGSANVSSNLSWAVSSDDTAFRGPSGVECSPRPKALRSLHVLLCLPTNRQPSLPGKSYAVFDPIHALELTAPVDNKPRVQLCQSGFKVKWRDILGTPLCEQCFLLTIWHNISDSAMVAFGNSTSAKSHSWVL